MKIKIRVLMIAISAAIGLPYAKAQFRGSNLMEAQWGNLPQLEPKDQGSIYDQLNLSYRLKSFNLNARVEQYYPTFGEDNSYLRLSQFRAEYNSKAVDIHIGNLYTTLGRGLVLRTYEIPGSIWETRGYRVRYGFYKDLLGASVKINIKDFEIKAVRGEVLDVALPPTLEDINNRRPDLVEGMEINYRFNSQTAGLIAMRNKSLLQENDEFNYQVSAFYDAVFLEKFSFYAEIAKNVNIDDKIYSFSENDSYAAYAGLSYASLNFGFSLEAKDYHDFFLGTGVNDPPSLVREHSYRLLNRSTHVPVLTDESGYQLELYYTLPNGNILTVNSSLAKNEISEDIRPVFQEYFAEYQFYGEKNLSGKVFIDYAKDPFVNEDNRYAAGGTLDLLHKKLSSNFEMEWQWIQRDLDETTNMSNWYFSYTLSKASKYSATVLMELTTDPAQIFDERDYNIYPSANFTYRPGKHIISLFYGKRRGGPACNSGVCYDVLDFQGLEVRWSSRF